MGKDCLVTHKGGCHCGAVRFEFAAEANLIAWDCNCSICKMKRNMHCICPEDNFSLLQGEDKLTEYRFGSKQARHLFCRTCGVQSFYIPRSNPDGRAVTVACIDPGTVQSLEVRTFDGVNWEQAQVESHIANESKNV